MKTNTQPLHAEAGSQAQVISLIERKNRELKNKIDTIVALAAERTEERTGIPQTLTRDQLIAKFRLEAQGRVKKDIILRADVRKGAIVGMTPEQSSRFDRGELAQVIDLKGA